METVAIIVNWNGYKDTIECLNSLLKNCVDLKVVVVDNHSSNESLSKIEKYLSQIDISYALYEEFDIRNTILKKNKIDYQILIIKASKNHGYAGGNNLGILFAKNIPSVKYFWLLNNDTTVDSNSLSTMVDCMKLNPKNGFVGSVARYYDYPEIIQCFGGGKIFPYLGKSKLIMKNRSIKDLQTRSNVRLDYLMGVSLLVKRDVVDCVGMMDEDYFMYSEEADWQLRAKRMGWNLDVAPDSFIYHKDSGSTKGKRHIYHYYRCRSAIIFAKKNYGITASIIASINLTIITIIQEMAVPTNILYGLKGILKGLFFKNIENNKFVDLFGLKFSSVRIQDAVADIVNSAKFERNKIVITPNVDHVVMIKKDPNLFRMWKSSDFLFADGMPLVWVSKLSYGPSLPERVTGADLMPLVCEAASVVGLKIMIVGGGPGVAEKAKLALEKKHPSIKVVKVLCPDFGFENDSQKTSHIVSEINSASPDILFFCVGAPKSEKWLMLNQENLHFGVALCVGAAVDFVAGNLKRAPIFLQKSGFEWLWRFLKEPGRLWKRYFLKDAVFVFYAIKEIYCSYIKKFPNSS